VLADDALDGIAGGTRGAMPLRDAELCPSLSARCAARRSLAIASID
jgi:hypothetical protein